MPKILNSRGEEITLTDREARVADVNQKMVNALGYEIPITTLTQITKKVSEQRFFKIPFADYVPVRVADAGSAFATSLTSFRSYNMADDFSTGVISMGANNARTASVDAGVDSLNIKVLTWAKSLGYSLPELETAARFGNWDVVQQKEKARKENWDLGLQKVAFLGLAGDPNCLGLLNQPGITTNTSLITATLGSLAATPQALSNVVAGLLQAFRTNANRTSWPNRLVIPESDYLSLATPSNPAFPVKSILQILLETLGTMTQDVGGFQILPCAYADKNYNGLGKNVYALYHYDEDTLRMEIPVDYTPTLANSIDGFSFQNVGYGQFTGVLSLRPQEIMYFVY